MERQGKTKKNNDQKFAAEGSPLGNDWGEKKMKKMGMTRNKGNKTIKNRVNFGKPLKILRKGKSSSSGGGVVIAEPSKDEKRSAKGGKRRWEKVGKKTRPGRGGVERGTKEYF